MMIPQQMFLYAFYLHLSISVSNNFVFSILWRSAMGEQ